MSDEENVVTKSEEEVKPSEEEEKEIEKETEKETDIVTIGDDAPPAEEDSSVIKHMRQVHKDVKTENRELKEKLAAATSPDESIVLGPKPTLENCEYDAEKLGTELDQWYAKKETISKAKAQTDQVRQQEDVEWQKKVDAYNEKKTGLNVPDYEEAEKNVHVTFSDTQQGLIIQGADNPALVVYALGKNPARAEELAAIKDPVKFVAAMSRLETKMKITKRHAETKPEEILTGSGPIISGDSTLDALRKEADKTGDYSKVVEYKRKTA